MQNAHILVIEDEPPILDNIMESLELEGYTVTGAHNGREGVEKALAIQPDLVLCDITMPVLDGYGVLLALRSDARTAHTPVIFLTARVDRASMRQGMELGADDYITKPFSAEEMLAAVDARLKKQTAIKAARDGALDTLRSNIIYALPHELRTPLTGIIGCADFLVLDYEHIDRQRLFSIAEIILTSGRRLENLLEKYLLYTQVEVIASDPQRTAALRDATCDHIAALIEETALARAEAHERSADLTREINPVTVTGGADELGHIIHALIDNAFRFSGTGSEVHIHAAPDDAGMYMLKVVDHGRGMTEEEVANIGAYMQFKRRIYEQQGLGLGLVTARRLTELLGGSFHIDSVPDQGTTVTVKLPLA